LQARWIFLLVDRRITVALPLDEVHKVLHRRDPEYASFQPTARSISALLRTPQDPELPGVLVILSQGDCWEAGDARLETASAGSSYCSISASLFERGVAWCRGALLASGSCAFVTTSALLQEAEG
jgi:hypothetical protein